MEKDNVSKDDLLNDLIDYVNQQSRPPASEGWFSATEVHQSGEFGNLNYKAVYYRLERGVEHGELEKMINNHTCYYRKIE